LAFYDEVQPPKILRHQGRTSRRGGSSPTVSPLGESAHSSSLSEGSAPAKGLSRGSLGSLRRLRSPFRCSLAASRSSRCRAVSCRRSSGILSTDQPRPQPPAIRLLLWEGAFRGRLSLRTSGTVRKDIGRIRAHRGFSVGSHSHSKLILQAKKRLPVPELPEGSRSELGTTIGVGPGLCVLRRMPLQDPIRFHGVFALGAHQPACQAPCHLGASPHGLDQEGAVRGGSPCARASRIRRALAAPPPSATTSGSSCCVRLTLAPREGRHIPHIAHLFGC
jgi:hypothetical protein